MVDKTQQIFIVNRKPDRLHELVVLVSGKFGSVFSIKTFNDNNSAVNSINESTEIIVFDNSLESYNKDVTLLTMKNSYPHIKTIMRTSDDEIEMMLDDYCKRKSFYLFRKGKTWEKFSPFLYNITNPMRKFYQEFLVRKFMVIFFLTFILMGFGIWFVISNYG